MVYVSMCVCVRAPVHVCRSEVYLLSIFLSHSPSYFGGQVLSLTPELTFGPEWGASESLGPVCRCFRVLR